MRSWLSLATRARRRWKEAKRESPSAAAQSAEPEVQLRAFLSNAPPFKLPAPGKPIIARCNEFAMAVEQGQLIPSTGVALRGWLSDPHDRLHSLWMEIGGGDICRTQIASRTFREDVLKYLKILDRFPNYKSGYSIFEPIKIRGGEAVTVKLHALVWNNGVLKLLTSGTTLEPAPVGRLIEPEAQAGQPAQIQVAQPADPEAQLRVLLNEEPRFNPPAPGSLVAVRSGDFAMAVEKGLLLPSTGVVLKGWLCDPHDRLHSLWIEMDGGTIMRTQIASRIFRKDVLEELNVLDQFPYYRAGYSIFEPVNVGAGEAVPVKLHALVWNEGHLKLLTSGTILRPELSGSLNKLLFELDGAHAGGDLIARTARPFLVGISSLSNGSVWRESRVAAPDHVTPDFSIVMVVDQNYQALLHFLASLEMCNSPAIIEVILVFRSVEGEEYVNRQIIEWRGTSHFAFKTLIPSRIISFGCAANAGIKASNSHNVAVVSDEVVPPDRDWITGPINQLQNDPKVVLIPQIVTFDGKLHDLSRVFEVSDMDDDDHGRIALTKKNRLVSGLLDQGCGVVLARADTLRECKFDESYSFMDVCLLDFLVRASQNSDIQLKTLAGEFTHIKLCKSDAEHPSARVWNLHALAGALESLVGDV